MAEVALSRISDGQDINLEYGDKIVGLDKETVERLRAQGSIGELPQSNQDQEAEKAELLTKLEEMQKQLADAQARAAKAEAANKAGQK